MKVSNVKKEILVLFPTLEDEMGKFLSNNYEDSSLEKKYFNIRHYQGFGLTCQNFGFDFVILNDLNRTKNIGYSKDYHIQYAYITKDKYLFDYDLNFKCINGIVLMNILPDIGLYDKDVINMRKNIEENIYKYGFSFAQYNFNGITETLERVI